MASLEAVGKASRWIMAAAAMGVFRGEIARRERREACHCPRRETRAVGRFLHHSIGGSAGNHRRVERKLGRYRSGGLCLCIWPARSMPRCDVLAAEALGWVLVAVEI